MKFLACHTLRLKCRRPSAPSASSHGASSFLRPGLAVLYVTGVSVPTSAWERSVSPCVRGCRVPLASGSPPPPTVEPLVPTPCRGHLPPLAPTSSRKPSRLLFLLERSVSQTGVSSPGSDPCIPPALLGRNRWGQPGTLQPCPHGSSGPSAAPVRPSPDAMCWAHGMAAVPKSTVPSLPSKAKHVLFVMSEKQTVPQSPPPGLPHLSSETASLPRQHGPLPSSRPSEPPHPVHVGPTTHVPGVPVLFQLLERRQAWAWSSLASVPADSGHAWAERSLPSGENVWPQALAGS